MSRLDNFDEILNSYEGREVEIVSPFSFNCLEWQPKAYREPNKDHKALLVFDDSQEKLVKAGYERHPSSAEAFSLIIAHLEGKLSPELDKIAEDMLSGPGEFFCQAIETKKISDRIIARIYEKVTAFPRNAATGYDMSGMRMENFITFDIPGLELIKYHHFKDIYVRYDYLIEYLTSRKYENLPHKIQVNGGIGLPEPEFVGPMGRLFSGRFGINFHDEYRASRGVRQVQSFKDSKGLGT